MNESHPSIPGLARAVAELLQERFLELESHAAALTTRVTGLELAVKSLERRVLALQTAERARTAAERSPRDPES